MRFTTSQDYQTILQINKELVNTVVDTTVVLYKLNQQLTTTNSYGEGTKKFWYQGVQIPALIDLQQTIPTAEANTVNVQQSMKVAFLRQECRDRNIYPEVGDILDFNNNYYEINNTNEIQLIAGQVSYNHSIVCDTHLVRNTTWQLEPPTL